MNVFVETKGQGEDVVLLHGGCDDHRYMLPIMDQLCDRYRVTVLDEPGRGKSKWQPQIETIFDLVDALLPVLPRKAIYINWSFGGLIALALAAKYPERVERIINIASVPKFIECDGWPGVPKPGFSQVISEIVEKRGLSSFLKESHDTEFKNFDPKPEAYNIVNSFVGNDSEVDMNAIRKRTQIVDETDLREEFESLHCSIDLILGDNDGAVPNALHEKLKCLNPKVNIHVIKGAQHMMVWTHPVEFNEILEDILSTKKE